MCRLSAGAGPEQVWSEVRNALIVTLGLKGPRFEADETVGAVPIIERDGRVDHPDKKYLGDGFALPSVGAALNVEAEGVLMDRIIVDPDTNVGVTREQRRTAVAIADQFAIALRKEPRIRSFA